MTGHKKRGDHRIDPADGLLIEEFHHIDFHLGALGHKLDELASDNVHLKLFGDTPGDFAPPRAGLPGNGHHEVQLRSSDHSPSLQVVFDDPVRNFAVLDPDVPGIVRAMDPAKRVHCRDIPLLASLPPCTHGTYAHILNHDGPPFLWVAFPGQGITPCVPRAPRTPKRCRGALP